NSRNTELLDFAALLEELVYRLLRDARHRTDWIPYVLPGADKHRINEAVRRKARLARQGSDSFAAPETARPRHGEIHRDLAWGVLRAEKYLAIAVAIDSVVASSASIATGKPAFRRAAAVTGPTAASAARAPSRERTSALNSPRRFST